ncbi:unnamed protein product [Staurois parvus]|uniref:Uncharacterized protein n=1 Tax=Staurois parvus TaxID=386267 RepID=A0ABN9D5U6_9NEOB|nr:unnamed protein product [Staurois parvus]
MHTDHQSTDDQCAMMISVAPEVPPVSATSMPHISAYQCTSMPHISAHLSCLSMSPISAISVAYQCASVPVSAAYQYRLSVSCISAAFQCPSVMPVNAHLCNLLVPPHQCPSVQPINAHHCSLISAHQ